MRLRTAAVAALLAATACGQAVATTSYAVPDGPAPSCRAPVGGHLVPSRTVHEAHDIAYADADPAERLDVYTPANGRRDRPAVLVVHGGGWNTGDKRNVHVASTALARAGFVAVAVDYTLARSGLAGADVQPDEMRAAVRWVRRHATTLGVDAARIGAVGSSAGGHLVALLATTGSGPCSTGDRVGAVVTWSGPFDLVSLQQDADRGCTDGCRQVAPKMLAYVGCPLTACPQQWADASPVRHVDAGDPPMLLFTSSREMVPAEQSGELAAALSAAGVPHDLVTFPGTRHAQGYGHDAMPATVRFLAHYLAGG